MTGRRVASPVLTLAIGWLALVVIVTALGPLLPFVGDPDAIDVEKVKAGPSWEHWFGNASFGQDVFSRVVVGGRLSLLVAGVVTVIGIVVGGGFGLAAGFYRGWIDSIVRLVVDATLSVPALLLVIFVVAVRGQSLAWVVVAVSLLAVPAIARVVRASTLRIADREYVEAAGLLGAGRGAVLVREVLPNVVPSLLSIAFLTTGLVLVAESSLSFLGLSVKAPTITWGSIIAEGRISFEETPHMVFLPALVLFLTVVSLNLVGDRLAARYDVRDSVL